MKKIKIVTDSSAQLTIDEINKYDIYIVPLSITFSDKTYTDGVDISREDFVKKMLSADELPKTSQPSIGLFEDVFKDLASDGSHILGIFLTQSLSGTISAAKQAADLLNLGDNITIIDSGLTDRALGLQVLAAAKDLISGKTLQEITLHIEAIKKNQHLEMMVSNLDNLIKGGRLGSISGKIATLLNIKLVLQMTDGKLSVYKKGRGKKFFKDFEERVLADIEANKNRISEVGISYVDTPDIAAEIAEKIHLINSDINVLSNITSPIISSHAGSGAIAIIYYTE